MTDRLLINLTIRALEVGKLYDNDGSVSFAPAGKFAFRKPLKILAALGARSLVWV